MLSPSMCTAVTGQASLTCVYMCCVGRAVKLPTKLQSFHSITGTMRTGTEKAGYENTRFKNISLYRNTFAHDQIQVFTQIHSI